MSCLPAGASYEAVLLRPARGGTEAVGLRLLLRGLLVVGGGLFVGVSVASLGLPALASGAWRHCIGARCPHEPPQTEDTLDAVAAVRAPLHCLRRFSGWRSWTERDPVSLVCGRIAAVTIIVGQDSARPVRRHDAAVSTSGHDRHL